MNKKGHGRLIFEFLDSVVAWALRYAAHRIYPKQLSTLLSSVASFDSQPSCIQRDGDLDLLIHALVAAEDRRFFSHFGVDSKGLARALLLFFTRRKIQGASTITQQLVRVLTKDYRYSVQRKFKEMCLACVVDREVSKKTQASIYLSVAYYGWRMNGATQAWQRLRLASPLSSPTAALLVARLRYPEPKETTPQYLEKLSRRARYVTAVMKR